MSAGAAPPRVVSGLEPRLFEAEVIENRRLAANGFLLSVLARGTEVRLAPGQFLMARASEEGSADPLLRRPLSPLDVRPREDGTRIDLLMTAVGRGTRIFQRKRAGDALDFLGPLGRGFSPLPASGGATLVAGGVGLAPIYHLAREAAQGGRAGDIHVIVGAREARLLFGVEAVEALGVRLEIATDRGDRGYHGNAVEAFEAALARGTRPAAVYGCGPERMLEALVRVARRERIPCEVSLERRMACGFGVCFTCVCRAIDAKTGALRNVRTCLEGPVIDAARLPEDAW